MASSSTKKLSEEVIDSLRGAAAAAKAFDVGFSSFRDAEREALIPLLSSEEIVISSNVIRYQGYCVEKELKRVNLLLDLDGAFGQMQDRIRRRFADRSDDGHYVVRYLQPDIINTVDGKYATGDMIMETKILMNMKTHPNIAQVFGVNHIGIDSFLESGRKSFFLITNRIDCTLNDRIHAWRKRQENQTDKTDELSGDGAKLIQRLEVALDIAAVLVYLHDRKICMLVRPDKIGFDTRYGRMKLCDFSQARYEGMEYDADAIKHSDDMNILSYTAPEVFCGTKVRCASDVYAFGIILWEMTGLELPFRDFDRVSHFQEVVGMNVRPRISPSWPMKVQDVLSSCFRLDGRSSMKDIHESLENLLLFADDGLEERTINSKSGNGSFQGLSHSDILASLSVKNPPSPSSPMKILTSRSKSSSSSKDAVPSHAGHRRSISRGRKTSTRSSSESRDKMTRSANGNVRSTSPLKPSSRNASSSRSKSPKPFDKSETMSERRSKSPAPDGRRRESSRVRSFGSAPGDFETPTATKKKVILRKKSQRKLLDSPTSINTDGVVERRSKSEELPSRTSRTDQTRSVDKKKLVASLINDDNEIPRFSTGTSSTSSESKLPPKYQIVAGNERHSLLRQSSGTGSKHSSKQSVRRKASAGVELEALRQAAARKQSKTFAEEEFGFLSPNVVNRNFISSGNIAATLPSLQTPKTPRSKSLANMIESHSAGDIPCADLEELSISPAAHQQKVGDFRSLTKGQEPILGDFDFGADEFL